MTQLKNYREVGIFDLLSAPLNPIGAFDAEQFKKDARKLIDDNPDDKFVAVDLMGLDFVYSDAYNAFVQFQSELSSKGGMLALLSNSPTIADGLRKAGLDRTLKVFAAEAEMMTFSLHSHDPVEVPPREQAPAAPVEPEAAPVASQNGHPGEPTTELRAERRTGHNRRFTKSFNAVVKDEKKLASKGMSMPFEEESSSGKTTLFIILVLLVLGGLAAYFLM